MRGLRIRSMTKNGASPWVTLQERRTERKLTVKAAPVIKVMNDESRKPRGRISQYGRFRFSDRQYGKIEAMLSGTIDISKSPIRMRNEKGQWIYTTKTNFRGAAPAVRIRSKTKIGETPWVYVQHEEV